jgi:hypothetical protein
MLLMFQPVLWDHKKIHQDLNDIYGAWVNAYITSTIKARPR